MRVYPLNPSAERAIQDADLAPLGPPEGQSDKERDGDPQIAARIDFQRDGMMAGIFEATTGKVEIHFPFTEHATIVEGEVTLTDESGQTHTYGPGDSYFIEQGQVILWEVTCARVRKAFFNITRDDA